MNKKLERIPCILCNNDDTEKMCEIDGFSYVRCRKCRLVYVNPRMQTGDISTVYEGSHIRSRWKDFLYRHRKMSGLQNLMERMRRSELLWYEVLRYKSEGKLLDIGCNRGFLLATAEGWGWETYGIELAYWMPTLFRKSFKGKIYNQPLADIESQFPDKYFDAVAMIDIIEHLHNPLNDMQIVRRILKDDGIIILNTSDIGSGYARIMGKKWGDFKPLEHLYLFDRQTLEMLLEKCELEIIRIQPSKGHVGEMEVHIRKCV